MKKILLLLLLVSIPIVFSGCGDTSRRSEGRGPSAVNDWIPFVQPALGTAGRGWTSEVYEIPVRTDADDVMLQTSSNFDVEGLFIEMFGEENAEILIRSHEMRNLFSILMYDFSGRMPYTPSFYGGMNVSPEDFLLHIWVVKDAPGAAEFLMFLNEFEGIVIHPAEFSAAELDEIVNEILTNMFEMIANELLDAEIFRNFSRFGDRVNVYLSYYSDEVKEFILAGVSRPDMIIFTDASSR